jgi:hypothetical protein
VQRLRVHGGNTVARQLAAVAPLVLDIDGINVRPDYAKRFLDAQTFEDEWGNRRQLTGDCITAASRTMTTTSARSGTIRSTSAIDIFSNCGRGSGCRINRLAIVVNFFFVRHI